MVLEWQNPALIGCRTTFNVWGRETRALINVAVVVGKCFFFFVVFVVCIRTFQAER